MMRLSPAEQEKPIVLTAAEVARGRRDRGLKPNHPGAVAIISAGLLEGVPEMVDEVGLVTVNKSIV